LAAQVNHSRTDGMKYKFIVLAIAIFATLFGCQFREPTPLPVELLGVWNTSAEKYEGCLFEIKKDSIIFANTRILEALNINTITKIETIHEEKRILCVIHYKSREDQEYKFTFYYDPSEGGSIRFKNQLHIKWVKAEALSIEELLIESD
jgi:hypothetical protein